MDKVLSELTFVGLAFLLACDRSLPDAGSERSSSRAADSALRSTPGYIVDSIFTPEEALRRFRAGLDTPATLDGPRSRDALMTRFTSAVRRADRRALDSLVVTRSEYAFLVYSELPNSRPPYRQPPDVAWLLLETSNRGASNKLVNAASRRFDLLGYACDTPAEQHGPLRLFSGCAVRVREGGGAERRVRLFGSMIERDGRWKLLALDGDL